MSGAEKRAEILIVNQHGENRGDEAAMRAMIEGLDQTLGGARFTVVVQFQNTSLTLPFDEDVTLLQMKMSYLHFLGLVVYAMLRRVGISLRFLLAGEARRIIGAYETADLVLSAPGGPYFGDIYANHEIVHWFYIWLGRIYARPMLLYATSAGPFEIRWLNRVRRHLYRAFRVLCVRENISRGHLHALLGEDTSVTVTADSALQQVVPPRDRHEYFTGEKAHLASRFLVAVSAIQYRFPRATDPAAAQAAYEATLLECLEHLHARKDCHFLLFPQLYGGAHSDIPFLESLRARLPGDASLEIVSQEYDSNTQRQLFGMCDLCIASRYHPQIFAASAAVPGICIYYEHKARGFMEALGMQEFAFDISDLDATRLRECLDHCLEARDALSQRLREGIPKLRDRAAETTRLAAALYRDTQAQRPHS
ncbi:MAG: polysaccharide pyruvyl transferase family protein [Pseudomonadota bacterium]